MKLYLMRHGHAVDYAPSDSQRALSGHGRKEVEAVLSARLGVMPDAVQLWASPYLRAQQTAEIVASTLQIPELNTCDLITPSGRIDLVVEWLQKVAEETHGDAVFVVSHLPLIGNMLNTLCGFEPGRHGMATATLAALSSETIAAGCCELDWIEHARY